MSRRFFVVCLFWGIAWGSLLGEPLVYAADVTDVADSFDEKHKNPFDFRLRISYEFMSESAVLAREKSHPQKQYFTYFPEFQVNHARHTMTLHTSIGLYRNLEFNLSLPLIFFESFK